MSESVAGLPVAVGEPIVLPTVTTITPRSQTIRTYGRVIDAGAKLWVEVDPDTNGFTDSIYLTTLIQVLKLNYGESPFYGDWGLPAHASVLQQVPPDYFVMLTQQRFAPHFLALAIAKVATPTPTYNVSCQFKSGATVSVTVIPNPLLDASGNALLDAAGNVLTQGVKHGRFVAT